MFATVFLKIRLKFSLNVFVLTLCERGALSSSVMCAQVECFCQAGVRAKIAFAIQRAVVVERNVPLVVSYQKLIRADWPILLDPLWIFLVLILYSYQFLYNT
jgi:hypothetical protein